MRGFGMSRKCTSTNDYFLTISSLFYPFKNQTTGNYDLLGTISRANIHTQLSSLFLTKSHFPHIHTSTSLLSLFNKNLQRYFFDQPGHFSPFYPLNPDFPHRRCSSTSSTRLTRNSRSGAHTRF